MTDTAPRQLVRLTGDDVHALPDGVRDEVFAWARANSLDPADITYRPIACVTCDPTGQETDIYVTEIEMDEVSDYESHVRRVPMIEPLPTHLVPYFVPVDDAGTVTRHQYEEGPRFAGRLPGHLMSRLQPGANHEA
jgi:hypothetical protein